ncbi:hypothetical protein DMH04_41190 [Kibdelosporangium aridum]|uniref:Uncharacterized protein n=1 Tax=Kibdelosporangium aridum TaxID=2030 RepID=A0A428YUX0_KIBAR|nr:hypothetical protein [Kibdelosporangium aridum]RSM73429.1 hypothetical protein DMH04_41190 [Kibdelosporangium aridum]
MSNTYVGTWPVNDPETGAELFKVESRADGQVSITSTESPMVVSPNDADMFRIFLGLAIGIARQAKP